MQTNSDTAAWLRLQLTPGVGAVASRRLLAAFSLPQNIFQQSPSALREVVSEKQTQALLQEPANFSAALHCLDLWLEQSGQGLITLGDANYPKSLLLSPDPPLCFYVQCADWAWWQTWAKQEQAPLLGMVGSRKPSPQGLKIAQTWAQEIAQSGFSVVSGLALGIDAAAHQGALQAPKWGLGRSIAVVGTGLDQVYPKQHAALAQSVLDAGGAIISEYPLGTPAIAANFPKRNRIIAGLSLGVLVVEAALQSGSLITARLAMEANREVFAVPGSIYALQSQGCHALIKQGAQLVESAQELIQALPGSAIDKIAAQAAFSLENANKHLENQKQRSVTAKPESHKHNIATQKDGEETPSLLLDALGFSPMALDALLLQLPYSAAQLQMDLLQLELAGKVARLPGGLYQRIV
jgi:DNA processing protein